MHIFLYTRVRTRVVSIADTLSIARFSLSGNHRRPHPLYDNE